MSEHKCSSGRNPLKSTDPLICSALWRSAKPSAWSERMFINVVPSSISASDWELQVWVLLMFQEFLLLLLLGHKCCEGAQQNTKLFAKANWVESFWKRRDDNRADMELCVMSKVKVSLRMRKLMALGWKHVTHLDRTPPGFVWHTLSHTHRQWHTSPLNIILCRQKHVFGSFHTACSDVMTPTPSIHSLTYSPTGIYTFPPGISTDVWIIVTNSEVVSLQVRTSLCFEAGKRHCGSFSCRWNNRHVYAAADCDVRKHTPDLPSQKMCTSAF